MKGFFLFWVLHLSKTGITLAKMIKLCINLDSRPDRWELAQKEFDKVGLEVQRMSAIVHDNRPLAFNQSVYKAMEFAKGDDLLLFEDDVVIDANKWPTSVPGGALTVHYGCNMYGDWKLPEKTIYADYAKLHNCWQSHATWYSKEAVDFILANLDPNVLTDTNNIFDDWLRRNVLSQGRSYVHVPMIAYQRPSFSDIWRRETDYTSCHIEGNLWLQNHCL